MGGSNLQEDRKGRTGGRTGVTIPVNVFRNDPFLPVRSAPQSHAAEEYRKIIVKLEQASSDRSPGPYGCMMVLSPLASEGKSVTAANVALALAADAGRRTLLVDFDLRRPGMERFLVQQKRKGLADVLRGDANLESLVQYCPRERLHVLTAGLAAGAGVGLPGPDRLADLLARLRGSYDSVIGDCPPLLPFAESRTLAGLSDSVLLVARAEVTPRAALAEAVAMLNPAKLLGVVLNAVPSGIGSYYGSGYGYRGYGIRDTRGEEEQER